MWRRKQSAVLLCKQILLGISVLVLLLACAAPWYRISESDETSLQTSNYFQGYYILTICSSDLDTCQERYTVTPRRFSSESVYPQAVYLLVWCLVVVSLLGLLPAFCVRQCFILPFLAAAFCFASVILFCLLLPAATSEREGACGDDDDDEGMASPCNSFWGSQGNSSWAPVVGFWAAVVSVGLLLIAGLFHTVLACMKRPRHPNLHKGLPEYGALDSCQGQVRDDVASMAPSTAYPSPSQRRNRDASRPLASPASDIVRLNPEDMQQARTDAERQKNGIVRALSPIAVPPTARSEKKSLKALLVKMEGQERTPQQLLKVLEADGRALKLRNIRHLAHWTEKHGTGGHLGVISAQALAVLAYPSELVEGIREEILGCDAWRVLLQLGNDGRLRLYRHIDAADVTMETEIAKGSGGRVFVGTWSVGKDVIGEKEGKKVVAIKVCQQNGIPVTSLDEFRVEAGVMSLLRHPNILQCYGANASMQHMFIVMPLVSGALSDLLTKDDKARPLLPWKAKLQWALDIAKALQFVHKWDIVYRDLKGCNVLLDKDRNCLLSDFGIARLVDRTQRMTIRQGTPAWMAPEMHDGDGRYTQKVDVYSYGVLLNEIAVQQRPLKERRSFDVPELVARGVRPDIPEFVIPPFKELMQRCWHTDPDQRPTFAQVVEDLQQHLASMSS